MLLAHSLAVAAAQPVAALLAVAGLAVAELELVAVVVLQVAF